METSDLFKFLKGAGIDCQFFGLAEGEAIERIEIRFPKGMFLNIIKIHGFENWIDDACLWQYYIQIPPEKAVSLNVNNLNYQLPAGFFSQSPVEDGLYYKYTHWIKNIEGFEPVVNTINIVQIIFEEIFG